MGQYTVMFKVEQDLGKDRNKDFYFLGFANESFGANSLEGAIDSLGVEINIMSKPIYSHTAVAFKELPLESRLPQVASEWHKKYDQSDLSFDEGYEGYAHLEFPADNKGRKTAKKLMKGEGFKKIAPKPDATPLIFSADGMHTIQIQCEEPSRWERVLDWISNYF